MKKLLRKLFSIALVGVMLSNVACKDYDDDINGLSNRIDELEGKVALKADLQAVQATVNQLAAIDFASFATNADLNAAIAKCASKDDLKNLVTSDALNQAVNNAVSDMQNRLDEAVAGMMTEADVQKVFNEMMAAYNAWAAVQSDVNAAIEEALKPYLKAEDAVTAAEVEAAIAEAVKDALTVKEVEKTIDAWMGKNFATYIEPYVARIDAIGEAQKDLEDANKALEDKLTKMIDDAETKADQTYIDAEELKTALDEYAKKIEAIEGRIAALEGRIQSLVWVPQTLAEMESGKVALAAQQYIMLTPAPVVDDEEPEGDEDQPATQADDEEDAAEPVKYILEDPAQTITWQVSPAAIVANLKAEDIHLDINSVTRADAELFSVGGVEFDAEKGLIVVTVEGDETALEALKDQPIVALHIQNENIDYRSEYLAVDYVQNVEAVVSVDYVCEGHEAAYNVESVAAFNDASKVVINKKPATEYGLTVSVTYTTDAEEVEVSEAGVVTGSFEVGQLLTVTGTWVVADAEGNFASVAVEETFTFTKELENEITFDAVKNAVWTLDMKSVKGEAVLAGITKKQYDALQAGAVPALYEKKDGEWVASSMPLTVEFPNSPSVDTDLMSVSVSVEGDFKQGGEYRVEITLADEKQDLVLFDEFKVTGFAFEAAGIEVAAETFTWNGKSNIYEIAGSENYFNLLWEANKAALEPYKYTEELFVASLSGVGAENADYAKLSRLSAIFNVEFTDIAAALAADEPVALKFTFSFEGEQEVVINFAGVQLIAPEAKLTANDAYVTNGAAKVNTILDAANGTFTVSDKELANAYKLEAPEGTQLVYSIDEDTDEMENAPVIEGGILKWNGWQGTSITIKAAAVLSGVELASESFEASFADPVAAKMIVTAYDPELGDENTVAPMVVAPGAKINVAQYFGLATATDAKVLVVEGGVVTTLGANMAGKITYEGETPNKELITINGSEIEVAETALELQKEYEVTIKATFSYQYGVDRTAEVTIKVAQ